MDHFDQQFVNMGRLNFFL